MSVRSGSGCARPGSSAELTVQADYFVIHGEPNDFRLMGLRIISAWAKSTYEIALW